jgi:hypothetical protein
LSGEERELARRNYQQLRALPAEQRQEVARRWTAARASAASGDAPPPEGNPQAQP